MTSYYVCNIPPCGHSSYGLFILFAGLYSFEWKQYLSILHWQTFDLFPVWGCYKPCDLGAISVFSWRVVQVCVRYPIYIRKDKLVDILLSLFHDDVSRLRGRERKGRSHVRTGPAACGVNVLVLAGSPVSSSSVPWKEVGFYRFCRKSFGAEAACLPQRGPSSYRGPLGRPICLPSTPPLQVTGSTSPVSTIVSSKTG